MRTPTLSYGLVVSPLPASNGRTVYAELLPSSPGRVWREKHIRWWFEIHETDDPTLPVPENVGAHHYLFDGGAMTLRGAIWKATAGVEAAIEQIQESGLREKSQ